MTTRNRTRATRNAAPVVNETPATNPAPVVQPEANGTVVETPETPAAETPISERTLTVTPAVLVSGTDAPVAAPAAAAVVATESPLHTLAGRLDALAMELSALGAEPAAKLVSRGAKSARVSGKHLAIRKRRVGKLVQQMKARGLSAEEILAQLS